MGKTKESPNYYSIIPAFIRYDKELKANEKLLYSEITALSNKNGVCWATNKYFANLYNVATQTISTWISHLKKLNYIDIKFIYEKNGKEISNRLITIKTPEKENLPINKNINTPLRKNLTPPQEKNEYPLKKNLKDNITSINTTRVNKDDDGSVVKIDKSSVVNFFEQNGFGLISPVILESIDYWINDFIELGSSENESCELIIYALEITVKSAKNRSWKYTESVLRNFINSKVINKDQAIRSTNKQLSVTNNDLNKYKIEIEQVTNYLNKKLDTNYSSENPETQNLISELLSKGYKINDFQKVIDNKISSWKNDKKMNVFLRPKTLFSKKHFEDYLNEKITSESTLLTSFTDDELGF